MSAGTAVVDTHVHIIVPEITRRDGQDEPWRPKVVRAGGRQRIEIGGVEVRPKMFGAFGFGMSTVR